MSKCQKAVNLMQKFPKYSFDQWVIIIATGLFLAGAVLMIINVFAAQAWALWSGFALAIVASALVIWAWVMHNNKQKNKHLNPPNNDIIEQ